MFEFFCMMWLWNLIVWNGISWWYERYKWIELIWIIVVNVGDRMKDVVIVEFEDSFWVLCLDINGEVLYNNKVNLLFIIIGSSNCVNNLI